MLFAGSHRRQRCCIDRLEPRRLFATYTVSSVADTGAGTLRQAILDANTTATADTIVFSSAFNSIQAINLATPLPQIGFDLTITGPGANLLTVRLQSVLPTTVAGVFSSTAANLALSGMTVTGARVSANGGGLASTGPNGPNIVLDGMFFVGNTVTGLGGAIYLNNNSKLTIRNSIIANNISGAGGGGICFFSNGALLMENCSLDGNVVQTTTSGGGGGLYFSGAALASPPAGYTPSTLVIRNSTFSNNHVARNGGAILVEALVGTLQLQNTTLSDNLADASGGALAGTGGTGTLSIQNSTITGNRASATGAGLGGGGIVRVSTLNNALDIVNSVVSGNTNAAGPDVRTDGFTLATVRFSAIGSPSGFTLAPASSNNVAFGANLQLDTLTNNGGPTSTRAILPGSPLLNAGSVALTGALNTDQRGIGFPRVSGATIDIGAFERAATGPAVTSHTFFFEAAPHALRYTFSENVAASLSTADLELLNLTTGLTIVPSSLSLSYIAASNTATFNVINPSNGILPDGRYRATLRSPGVTNAGGAPLANSDVLFFHVLAGDATRDGIVNFDDLLRLAQNYGLAGKSFSQGNFNYSTDGLVGFDDLLILAQKYGQSVLVAEPVIMPARSKRRIEHETLVN